MLETLSDDDYVNVVYVSVSKLFIFIYRNNLTYKNYVEWDKVYFHS